jgi:LmbE family N-acetylglucosaminyl deacetylase
MRIASIHAHPDDAEILAGGTLALLAQAGHAVTIVTMTPGDKGSDVLAPEEIAAVRRVEAMTAAALIGADYRCAEFRDMEIFSDDTARRRVVELVRQLKADIVITAAPSDYLADHEATSMLVRDALFAAQLPNYRTESPPLPAVPALYFMDPIEGLDREGRAVTPDFVVDVQETFEIKKAMLAAHATQRDWLQRHHGMDNYLISMEQWTRQRGDSAGCKYGEGFRQYTGHPYPRAPHLQAALAEYVRSTSAA